MLNKSRIKNISVINTKKSEKEDKNKMDEIMEDIDIVDIDVEIDEIEEIVEVEDIEVEEYYSDDTKEEVDYASSDSVEEYIVEESDDEDDDEDKDDMLTIKKRKRKSQIDAGIYIGKVTKVEAKEKPSGIFGQPWIMVIIRFIVNNPRTGEDGYVNFIANKSLDPSSRLYPVVRDILGYEPGDDFNLKELMGKQALVTVGQSVDKNGNIWDNVVSVRKSNSAPK